MLICQRYAVQFYATCLYSVSLTYRISLIYRVALIYRARGILSRVIVQNIIRDMSHSSDAYNCAEYVAYDCYKWVTTYIWMNHVAHLHMNESRHTYNATHIYVRHYMCDVTHSYVNVQRDSFICTSWRIHNYMWGLMHLLVWRDSFICKCARWFVHMYDMTHSRIIVQNTCTIIDMSRIKVRRVAYNTRHTPVGTWRIHSCMWRDGESTCQLCCRAWDLLYIHMRYIETWLIHMRQIWLSRVTNSLGRVTNSLMHMRYIETWLIHMRQIWLIHLCTWHDSEGHRQLCSHAWGLLCTPM